MIHNRATPSVPTDGRNRPIRILGKLGHVTAHLGRQQKLCIDPYPSDERVGFDLSIHNKNGDIRVRRTP